MSKVETWRSVPGFEALYEVSCTGRVRSLRRSIVLKPGTASGYLYVVLCGNTKRVNARIHSLVAECFIGARPKGYDVNHINGDKADNSVGNLEYCTRSANLSHAFKNGLKTHKGSNHPKAIYSDKQILMLKKYLSDGYKHREVAELMNVPMHLVADVSAGRQWQHI